MTALVNVMETEIFCRRYLKFSNSTVKEYFLTNFCDAFRIPCTKFCWAVLRDLAFLSNFVCVYFFPGHSVRVMRVDKSLMTKKVDGIKESSDSSAVIEDEDGQGNLSQ